MNVKITLLFDIDESQHTIMRPPNYDEEQMSDSEIVTMVRNDVQDVAQKHFDNVVAVISD